MPCAWKIVRHIPGMDLDRDALKRDLTERAKNYDLPSSENNKQEQDAFASFFDSVDSYTGIAFTVVMTNTFAHSIPLTSFTIKTGTSLPR